MQQTHTWIDAIRAIYAIPGPIQILEDRQQSAGDRVRWQRLRIQWQDAGRSFGLCLNTLRFPAGALCVFVTRFHESGRRRLFEDEDLQRAIAHAYWQTTWAGSAIRVQRGETWPVAFLPIHRPAIHQAPPAFHEPFSVGPRHWIFGRERRLLWQLQRLAEQGRLYWQDGRFDADADPEWLAHLQARGFIDRFIGGNREPSGRRRIEKLIPVHGSHLLTRLATGEAVHFSAGNINTDAILAATNSGFFLNFPEEYGHPWTVMNDPVGLYIEHGEIAQLPIVHRGALLVDAAGRATVARVSMRDVALRLPWETAWREYEQEPGFALDDFDSAGRQMVVYTPAFIADGAPEARRTPEAAVLDLTVLFGDVVEARVGGGTPIPASGLVVSVPLAWLPSPDPEAILKPQAAPLRFRFLHERLGLQAVRTAVAAGPVLLEDGEHLILPDYFNLDREDFRPARLDHGRWTVAGLPPTRFPHDVTETRAPRTLAGVLPTGELMLIIVDGRLQEHSVGATLSEAAALLRATGCVSGLNLDGGGSSVLYLRQAAGTVPPLASGVRSGIVNLPSDVGHQERLIPVPLFIMDNGG